MAAKTISLRRRLLAWLLPLMLLLCALLLAQAYWNIRQSVEKIYDKTLLALALTISESVVASQGDLLSEAMLEILENVSTDAIYYKVSGPDNAYLTGYADLPPKPDDIVIESGIPYYYDAFFEDRAVRAVILKEYFGQRELSGWVEVQVAMTRSDRDALIRELVGDAASRLLLLVALAATVVWFAIQNGLKPLDAVKIEVANRGAGDLQPIAAQAPREIVPLVSAINQLMARLERNLGAMQQFIADATHQLRTPLAVIQTQAELTLREEQLTAIKSALRQLLESTRRATRLANQLLDHARASSDISTLNLAELDLAELAAQTTAEMVPLALKRNMDLGFENGQNVIVQGDNVLLKELLKNLIDNAIRYCPEGTRITVRAGAGTETASALLEVEDNGPGIAASERERVLERFYRGCGSDSDGSGLGLAIVKEIARTHGGQISLGEGAGGRGLTVKITLPGLKVQASSSSAALASCRSAVSKPSVNQP